MMHTMSMPSRMPATASESSERTMSPIVTGTSILACKYKDGVMLMADTLGSYGSMAMFKSLPRIHRVNEYTIIGGGGEYSDFQYINKLLEQQTINDFVNDDGNVLSPSQVHSWLTRVLYNRRSKVNPLWNQLLVAGYKEGNGFLGYVDLLGTHYQDNVMATGYGEYLALPLLRKGWTADMTAEQARKLLEDSMSVLLYRDARTINQFQLATITKDGPSISMPYRLENTQWDFKRFVNPHSAE